MSRFAADNRISVCSREEVVVAADRETAWNVIASIEEWPKWNPDVRAASIDGDLTEGTNFKWKAGPGTIQSTLRQVDRPRVLGGRARRSAFRQFMFTVSNRPIITPRSFSRSRGTDRSRVCSVVTFRRPWTRP
jgi:Polyketide cyclase / dehydrase and lipid transport